MRSSDLQREENFNEYLRLLQNDDYIEVTYDEESGGMSAVHKYHKFDKQYGPYGVRRGEYERTVLNVMRITGCRIILESELSIQDTKKFDGYLDDIPMEIKAIEGHGTWTVSTKLREAEKQHAECVILFFPVEELYSEFRVAEGIRLSQSGPERKVNPEISRVIVIVSSKFVACWDKKATPIEGWSVLEGLRGRNGADPLTIPPSDAKV